MVTHDGGLVNIRYQLVEYKYRFASGDLSLRGGLGISYRGREGLLEVHDDDSGTFIYSLIRRPLSGHLLEVEVRVLLVNVS